METVDNNICFRCNLQDRCLLEEHLRSVGKTGHPLLITCRFAESKKDPKFTPGGDPASGSNKKEADSDPKK